MLCTLSYMCIYNRYTMCKCIFTACVPIWECFVPWRFVCVLSSGRCLLAGQDRAPPALGSSSTGSRYFIQKFCPSLRSCRASCCLAAVPAARARTAPWAMMVVTLARGVKVSSVSSTWCRWWYIRRAGPVFSAVSTCYWPINMHLRGQRSAI